MDKIFSRNAVSSDTTVFRGFELHTDSIVFAFKSRLSPVGPVAVLLKEYDLLALVRT